MYKLSPSKAHRFLNCTKSLEFDVDFIETPVTMRGSILHTLAEMSLRNQETMEYIAEHKINEYELYLINEYTRAVWNETERIKGELIIEKKKPIIIFNNNINLIVDALIIGETEASIIDLKTGNADVDVEDNEQLYFYAYMVATQYNNIETFYLNIFQKGILKTYVVTKNQVFDFFLEKEHVFLKIEKNELEYNPSDKACKFCSIKDKCMARAKWIIGGKK
jgi:hypothetical protein